MNLSKVYHGVKTEILVSECNDPLFRDVPEVFEAGRYHSWAVSEKNLPACLKVTARDEDGMIMALSHTDFDVRGVQFHPESIMTEQGRKIVDNWLKS
jgi:anthranilate synthase component II